MPVYLNFRNPLRFDSLEEMANAVGEAESVEAYLNELRSAGYDSIIVEADEEYGGASYVALEPNQIKSATENVGSFSSSEDDIRYFRTPGGEAYGFTVDGKIYLDPRIATAETPIHEYAHLWADMIRNVNAEAWNDIVGLMKATPIWEEVRGLYPELKTDDEIADEVLAHYSGRRGAERLREAQQHAAAETGKSVFERAAAVAAIERVKQALAKFWQSVAELFHIRFTSAEEVADRVLADMLNGVNPNKYIKRKGKGVQKLHLNDKTLAGIHNITEEKLRKALNLGGLANPSLAIIDTAQNKHEDFGEISLIAPSALVDKGTGQTAGTWTTDAYTQRYPQVERVMSDVGFKKFNKWVESLDLLDSEKSEIKRQTKEAFESNRELSWELIYLLEKELTHTLTPRMLLMNGSRHLMHIVLQTNSLTECRRMRSCIKRLSIMSKPNCQNLSREKSESSYVSKSRKKQVLLPLYFHPDTVSRLLKSLTAITPSICLVKI